MTRFYLDHDVAAQTAQQLRLLGHDVVTVRERSQERAPDYLHLLAAAMQDRLLVTHNEQDYLLLHGAWQLWSATWGVAPRHGGILIIPQWRPALPNWDPAGAAAELSRLAGNQAALVNDLRIWRRSKGWVQYASM